MDTVLLISALVLLCAAVVLLIWVAVSLSQIRQKDDRYDESFSLLRRELNETLTSSVRALGDSLAESNRLSSAATDQRLSTIGEQFTLRLDAMTRSISNSSMLNEQKLEQIRNTVAQRLDSISQSNEKKLEQMRLTVDEKLKTTLEERLGQSFSIVSERLEQVYKGLGEMQTLATGVGDLKRVLSNVKTRGIIGEIQLGAILDEILAPEQYVANIATKSGSRDFVEYAVKMPGEDGNFVYLPIDSKFPADAYSNLMDAYDSGSPELVAAAGAVLERRIRQFAKDIRDKYIDPPNTTDFGIMFLPFEGLYAEVIRRGLVEPLQHDYKINIAGPTTMAAILNSLQMGFKTLAIQKRSGEVWAVLGAVKTEFDKFSDVLVQTQQRLDQANSELDKLIGVRTRQIRRKLKDVTSLPEAEAQRILPSLAAGEDSEE